MTSMSLRRERRSPLLFGLGGYRGKRRLELVIINAEFTNEIAVHHTRSLPVAEKRNSRLRRGRRSESESRGKAERVSIAETMSNLPEQTCVRRGSGCIR